MKNLSLAVLNKQDINKTNFNKTPIKIERETNILLGNHLFKIFYKKLNDTKSKITEIKLYRINNDIGDMDFKLTISRNYLKNAVKEEIKGCKKVSLDKKVIKFLDELEIPEYLDHLDGNKK